MRKVMVSEYKQQPDMKYILVEKGEALFHALGVDSEEVRDGVVNFSTAIVEWPDGTVGNIPVPLIRFLKDL